MSIGNTVALPVPLVPSIVLFGAIGALATALAHRGVSVFHDGLRPVMSSYRNCELPQREVSKTSFKLAGGFLWAFALPYSVGYVIPLVYIIFMATDWIGVTVRADHSRSWYRSRAALRGTLLAFVLGGLWGGAMAMLVRLVTEGMAALPVPMAEPVQLFAQPAAGAYFLFAVLTVAYHYGYRKALIALLGSSLAWFAAETVELSNPSAWAFGVAGAFLTGFLVQEARRKRLAHEPASVGAGVAAGDDNGPSHGAATVSWAEEDDGEDDGEADVFTENARRIRRALVPIVALSALMGAAFNWAVLTTDPLTGLLYAQGLAIPAALVALAWAVAFYPMKFTTAALTGCMATGTFLDQAVAVLMPNPAAAAAAVGALRLIEVLALLAIVRGVERFPTIREVADVMRTAIFHVMEIGFLFGGALAASAFAGEWGVAIVIAAWFLNNRKNSPVMPISIGAYAALAVGLFVNVLALLGLEVA